MAFPVRFLLNIKLEANARLLLNVYRLTVYLLCGIQDLIWPCESNAIFVI